MWMLDLNLLADDSNGLYGSVCQYLYHPIHIDSFLARRMVYSGLWDPGSGVDVGNVEVVLDRLGVRRVRS